MPLLRRGSDEDDQQSVPDDEDGPLVFEGETLSHSPRLFRRAYRRMKDGDE